MQETSDADFKEEGVKDRGWTSIFKDRNPTISGEPSTKETLHFVETTPKLILPLQHTQKPALLSFLSYALQGSFHSQSPV